MSTVTSVGVIVAVTTLAAGVAAVGVQVADAHRAQVAAELAAVAGATALYRGALACGAASHTAALNHAAATGCELADGDVTVTATVRGAAATARAGPSW